MFGFRKHHQKHAVYRLSIHLPFNQPVYFKGALSDADLQKAMHRDSMLTGWFKLCARDPRARQYRYTELSRFYKWRENKWLPRKRGGKRVISRLYMVDPRNRELFALRLLVLHVRGATSYEYLRTVDHHVYPTFAEAASALRLLEDDREWDRCMNEAVSYQMPFQLRLLFAFICLSAGATVDPMKLWEKYKVRLCEDLYRKFPAPEAAESRALALIQQILDSAHLSLSQLGLPAAHDLLPIDQFPSDVDHEAEYKKLEPII